MTTAKARLLARLRERSFRQGEFTLASGKKSDFFIDCKRTILSGDGLVLVGEVVLDALERAAAERGSLDAVAAVPLGGVPIADAAVLLAAQRGRDLGLLYVRSEKKDHGTGQKIEGAQRLDPGARVALVEDVITTGGSSLRAVEVLRGAGFEVREVIVLVDRLEGGREALESAGVTVRSVFTRHDFIAPAR